MPPKLGLQLIEVSIPDWPYGCLNAILFAESAAAFEELTLSRQVDSLKVQTPDAWPNTFRQSRFISAVDFVQADRMRRAVAQQMQRIFSEVDLLLVPALRDEMLTISNFTGHPSRLQGFERERLRLRRGLCRLRGVGRLSRRFGGGRERRLRP